jgi:hypothetical protein
LPEYRISKTLFSGHTSVAVFENMTLPDILKISLIIRAERIYIFTETATAMIFRVECGRSG